MSEVLVTSGLGKQVLRCEDGHLWLRNKVKGQPPRRCSEHPKPKQEAKERPRPSLNDPRRKRALEMAQAGMSLRKIGKELGVTGECVRLWLRAAGFGKKERTAVRWEIAEARRNAEAERLLAIAKARPGCRICGGLVLARRKDAVTCSTECAKAWTVLRVHTDEGRRDHLMAVAKSNLKHRDRRSATAVEWAERYIAGETKRRKQWFVPGSQADELAKKFWGTR